MVYIFVIYILIDFVICRINLNKITGLVERVIILAARPLVMINNNDSISVLAHSKTRSTRNNNLPFFWATSKSTHFRTTLN